MPQLIMIGKLGLLHLVHQIGPSSLYRMLEPLIKEQCTYTSCCSYFVSITLRKF